MVFISIKMEMFTKEIGKMMKNKALGSIILLMEIFTKEISIRVKNKVKEYTLLPMEKFMKDFSKTIILKNNLIFLNL